jgi:hypothetical protein
VVMEVAKIRATIFPVLTVGPSVTCVPRLYTYILSGSGYKFFIYGSVLEIVGKVCEYGWELKLFICVCSWCIWYV